MKAILEFDLNEPDDREDHKRAVKVNGLYVAIWEFDQYLRTQIKYTEQTQEVYDKLDEVRETLHNKLAEHEWNLD
jgi:hypothetical protein